jgi:hypothetical protein
MNRSTIAFGMFLLVASAPSLAEVCKKNEYVSNPDPFLGPDTVLVCEACPISMTNEAGDSTDSGQPTVCDLVDEELVSIEFEAPNDKDELTLLSDSGWPLSLKVTVPYTSIDFETGGILRQDWPGRNSLGAAGYVIFENPTFDRVEETDGELVLDDCGNSVIGVNPAQNQCVIFPGPPFEDARYIRYNSDVDMVGVRDVNDLGVYKPSLGKGKRALKELLIYSAGSRGPEIQKMNGRDGPPDECFPGHANFGASGGDRPDNGGCVSFGPDMGGEVVDGWGIGTDDDLPGLFIYSEKGIGLVWNEPSIELAHPAGVRNLAGMLDSVSFEISELKNKKAKTKKSKKPEKSKVVQSLNIHAHMNVNVGVLSSMLFVDPNGNTETYKVAGSLYQLDGQEPAELPEGLDIPIGASGNCIDNTFIGFLREDTYEVRAFMVSGEAPAQLNDYNTDGLVNVQDAIDDPNITVISNEASVQFLQYSESAGSAFRVIREMFADLDDSGDTEPSCNGGQGSSSTRLPLR